MLRSTLVAIAFAAAIAASAAATPLSYDPCETQNGDGLDLRSDHRPPPGHHFSFTDGKDGRPHRHHRDRGDDFHPGGDDWQGHDGRDCTPVPEPTALALLAAAALLIARRSTR